jgi:hypothetical protein
LVGERPNPRGESLDETRRESFVDQGAEACVIWRVQVEHVELERLEHRCEEALEVHPMGYCDLPMVLCQPWVLECSNDVRVTANEPRLATVGHLGEADGLGYAKLSVG